MSASKTEGAARAALDIKKHRLVLALQPDVEDIGKAAAFFFPLRDQRAAAIRRDKRKDRVGRIARLIGKIDPRLGMPRQTAREDRDQNMRRLRLAVRPGNGARLDGAEAEAAFRVGSGAPEAGEFRIRPLPVGGMGIAARRVGLPDLDHGVIDRGAVAVEYPALQADALPGSIRRDQVVSDRLMTRIVFPGGERGGKERSDGL